MEVVVRCPKCNSSDLETKRQGYDAATGCAGCILVFPLGLLFGLIGANGIKAVCLSCGHKFQRNTYYPIRMLIGILALAVLGVVLWVYLMLGMEIMQSPEWDELPMHYERIQDTELEDNMTINSEEPRSEFTLDEKIVNSSED